MTAMVASLGFAPMALSTSVGAEGDGLIYVSPVEAVVHIRTGLSGEQCTK